MPDFTIATENLPPPSALCEYLDDGSDSVNYLNPSALLNPGSWDKNRSVVYYCYGWSTRGVECWMNKRALTVRIPQLSSAEDFEIGLAILEYAAAYSNDKHVRTNFRPAKLPITRLREIINYDWINNEYCTAIAAAFDSVLLGKNGKYRPADDSVHVSMYGPTRNFYLGRQTIERLVQAMPMETEADVLAVVEFVHLLMRSVNYPEVSAFKPATILPLENDRQAAFVTRNEQLFVPEADCIYLNDYARGCWAALPAEHVREQFSAAFREPEQIVWFDEFQFGLQPIPELTYHAFVKRVAPLCQSINLLPSSLLHQHGLINLVE